MSRSQTTAPILAIALLIATTLSTAAYAAPGVAGTVAPLPGTAAPTCTCPATTTGPLGY
ncbi:MAG: hypothetical protein P4M00_10825 [Azospirillaceae bacterium]|nr:hypothetical protein [Azospirillaceae bacterium]